MTGIFLNEWASKEEMIASFEDVSHACDLTDEQKEKYAALCSKRTKPERAEEMTPQLY